MDTGTNDGPLEERLLAQDRILDALLKALALQQPALLSTIRTILIDTEFSHPGKPQMHETVHEQIRKRMDIATRFARDHGAGHGE